MNDENVTGEEQLEDDEQQVMLPRLPIPKELHERIQRIKKARGVSARNDMVRMLISMGCDAEEERLRAAQAPMPLAQAA